MKRIILTIILFIVAFTGMSDVKTNYVYVVSNIYNQVFTETVVTQKVKSTHTNYYITNNVTTVNKIYNTTFKTNMSVNCDVSQAFVIAASNEANRASGFVTNASSFADSAAASATTAGGHASSASTSASQASYQRQQAANECASALATINARINWFDQHSGETITMITSNVTINVNAQDYSYTYTNAAGTAFDYISVHPYGQNGGATVAPRSESVYSTVNIRAWPSPRESGDGHYWDFTPAYVDSDENGMRLQYLPTTQTPIGYKDANNAYPNGKIVPEYFYWQSGYIYFKVRVWENGVVVAWCLTRYEWENWPNTIGYGGDSGTAMTLVSRQLYGDSSMGTSLAYFYSKTRTDAVNTPIQFPMSPSASWTPTLEWMRNGPIVSELQTQVANLASQWTTAQGQWTTMQGDWSTMQGDWTMFQNTVTNSLTAFDTRLTNAENGYPHAYVSPGGTTYSNIIYYDRATDDGKIAVTTVGNYYPSTQYRIVPNYGGSAAANYWLFEPAYVDTDVNGLRIHYLPTQAKTITATTYNAGYKYVPRDFYWQNGVIYFVMDSYNGTTWSGRLRMKYAGTEADAWPNGVLNTYGGSILNATHYRTMTFDSREGTIMGTATSFIPGYFKTEYNKVMPSYDSVLWIPATYSTEQKAIVDWLATFIR